MSLTINQKGLNATLGRWKNDRCSPLFAIYQNRTCICQNVENDFDKATEKLENFFADNKSYEATPLTLKMYPLHKKATNAKEDPFCEFMFCVSETPSFSGSMDAGMAFVINDLKEKVSTLTSELNALKEVEDQEEEEEEEESETESFINGINDLLNNPAINNLIGMFTEKFMNNSAPVTKLAGISDDQHKGAVYQYVEILLNKGVTVDHLRKLAEMPGIKIKTLLNML